MTRRDPVVVAWAAGLGLAVLVYLVGPDHFLFRLDYALNVLASRVAEALLELTATALDVIRALSIGLFVTFLALAATVSRRGGRWKMATVVVTVLFLLLIDGSSPGGTSRWMAALILSAVGSAVMTGRLRQGRLPVRA